MYARQEVPVVSSDAGDEVALANPNSPASIMKKAKQQEAQSAADMKYDATAPPPEGFQNCVVEWENPNRYHEIVHALFLAASTVLFLYAAAPGSP
jgi:hypothetical protein